jgi:xylulokinase
VLEGVAFELRLQLELLEDATGSPVRELRAVGGGARSELWAQIVADITGREVRVCSAGEISAAGAIVGALEYVDVADAVEHCVATATTGSRLVKPIAPAQYDHLFEAYRGLYPALKETFQRLESAG